MSTVVSVLTVDARPAEQGVEQFARAMQKATAARERETRAEERFQAMQQRATGLYIGVGQSIGRTAQQWDRLRASLDPVAAAHQRLEQGMRLARSAVNSGRATHEDAAAVVDRLRQSYTAAAAAAQVSAVANDNAARSTNGLGAAGRAAVAGLTPLTGVAGAITGALGPVGLAIGAVAAATHLIASAGDQWTAYGNRLVAAGVASANVAATQRDLADLAMSTRSNLGATVDLYARMTRASAELGVSQTEVRRVTEILSKELATAGLSAGEAAGGLLQFSQGLQSGRFNGDELRSVLENLPGIARAIAREFGTTVGGLREMGSAGELASERVFRAVLKAGQGVDEAFGKSIPTAASAMEALGTASTRLFAEVDRRLGISQNRAQAIVELAQAMTWMADKVQGAGKVDVSGQIAQLQHAISIAGQDVKFFDMRGMTADADAARANIARLEEELRKVQGASDAAAISARQAAEGFGDVARLANTAAGAVAGFNQALRTIQGGIPEVAKVLTAQKELAELSTLSTQAAEKSRTAMVAESLDRHDAADAAGRHAARIKELNDYTDQRRRVIVGATELERTFGDTLKRATIDGLEGQAKAQAQARDAFDQRNKAIADSVKLGMSEVDANKARATSEQILAKELRNSAAAASAKSSASSSSGADGFDTAIQRSRDQIEELRLQADMASRATVEVYMLTEAHRLRRAAMQAGRLDEAGVREQIDGVARALAEQRAATEASIQANRRLKESFDFAAESWKSFAEDLLMGSDGINGALKNLGRGYLSASLDALLKGGGTLADVTDAENTEIGALLGIASAKPAGANDNVSRQHLHDAAGGACGHGRRRLSQRRDHDRGSAEGAPDRAPSDGAGGARAQRSYALAG